MRASREQVKHAIELYVDRELNKGNAMQKFMVFGASYLLLNKIDSLWEQLKQNAIARMFFEDDQIEVSELIGAMRSAMNKTGSMNVGGIIFTGSDVDALERYMNEAVANY